MGDEGREPSIRALAIFGVFLIVLVGAVIGLGALIGA